MVVKITLNKLTGVRGLILRVEFGRAVCGNQFTSDIKVVSACSSSASTLQENVLYGSVNTMAVGKTGRGVGDQWIK